MAFSYVVQKGDTVYRIAKRLGVRVQEIAAANPQLGNVDQIVPGQMLTIPQAVPNRYVVQRGDTFYYITKRFDIAPSDLLAANPGLDPQRLQAGRTILLPSGKRTAIVDTTVMYGYVEMMDDISALLQAYPFIGCEVIGESVLRKDIPALRIGTGPKRIHYQASIHANEWITAPLLMKFAEEYAAAYSGGTLLRGRSARKLYENATLWLAPMLNPDGVELVQEGITPQHPYYRELLDMNNGSFDFSKWKANIRGVDLNDQFPARWEAERERRAAAGPGPSDYSGAAPLCEPEAKAIADFTRSKDFSLIVSFHTQGREIYWNYRDLEPFESESIAKRFGQASGYRVVKLTGSDAGCKDWFIQDFRRPGFTVEAGIGVNPLPIGQFPAIYNETVGIMLEGLNV
ncbi:M14 family zinc carboxypeptidase [Paenibacillus contaminans]|uniref:Peptidase M14 n=1 Tax=Paenibacillus contaminans TaxID=450362 RepID=A0A329MGW6_9BACL|nr:M14 family zinc carboxypeptidase [Paenibacillus contaminans]RAV19084.1 peptidase M14 [Paenibacillus contaminans]